MIYFVNLKYFSTMLTKFTKKNIDDFINEQLNCVRICFVVVIKIFNRNALNLEYNEKFQKIVKYLIILNVSRAMNRKELRKFKFKTLKFLMREKHFFK